MIEEGLKLTAYLGERARVSAGAGAGTGSGAGGRLLADAITDVFARHELAVSLLLRGVEGFGARGGVRTDRLLTLSEDLPLVSVAVDGRERIEAAHAEVAALGVPGLLTLERARLVRGKAAASDLQSGRAPADEETKLTVYVGRHERERDGRRPAYEAVVAALHAGGVAGATVLLGVDGTVDGERRRARLLGHNAAVPLMVVAVGARTRIAAVLPELDARLTRPLLTLERVQVLKRDGTGGQTPCPPTPGSPPTIKGTGGLAPCPLQKLVVYAGEQSRHRGAPLSPQLVRALRSAGAAGATSLRGIWGYHGDHAPHGDTVRQLRRRVPVVTVVVDAPERIAALWPVVDAHTDETGLVTCELVPVAWRGRPSPRQLA
ncbi:MAG TPA: DUF190 domain-containing protein [Solirubrobacteraceae bacterium]|nr:DUF190 domain-containing protein [Solirubrobacteraceae bacterium]